MLLVENLHVSVDDKPILRGVDLAIDAGSVHAIMGPNGSGKSTLAHVLAGRPGYVVTAGRVLYDGHDLLSMAAEERAREGVFLAFQYRSRSRVSATRTSCAPRSTPLASIAAWKSSTAWISSSCCATSSSSSISTRTC
jgi:ABC-type cobalamin/Fe3+-siderophores transport system ATPase subunit